MDKIKVEFTKYIHPYNVWDIAEIPEDRANFRKGQWVEFVDKVENKEITKAPNDKMMKKVSTK